MFEHENHKTMRSHAQLVSASKARAVAIFVDLMVLSLGRKSRARETSEVPKMIGICLAAERMKRCVQFTEREREIEAEIECKEGTGRGRSDLEQRGRSPRESRPVSEGQAPVRARVVVCLVHRSEGSE